MNEPNGIFDNFKLIKSPEGKSNYKYEITKIDKKKKLIKNIFLILPPKLNELIIEL